MTKGGAANLVPATRHVYSNVSANVHLNDPANHVSIANTTGVTAALLGVGATAWTRNDVIDFINGQTPISGQPRNQMGDPLHSQPVSVIYGPDLRDGLLFVATNDGFLHALDARRASSNGHSCRENSSTIKSSCSTTTSSPASTTRSTARSAFRQWPTTTASSSPAKRSICSSACVAAATFYYALDITDRNDPQLLWRRDATQWTGLGESWSPPAPTRVKIGSTEHVALVIGGGYENDQDNDASTTDTTGNSIYIVDSATGSVCGAEAMTPPPPRGST